MHHWPAMQRLLLRHDKGASHPASRRRLGRCRRHVVCIEKKLWLRGGEGEAAMGFGVVMCSACAALQPVKPFFSSSSCAFACAVVRIALQLRGVLATSKVQGHVAHCCAVQVCVCTVCVAAQSTDKARRAGPTGVVAATVFCAWRKDVSQLGRTCTGSVCFPWRGRFCAGAGGLFLW